MIPENEFLIQKLEEFMTDAKRYDEEKNKINDEKPKITSSQIDSLIRKKINELDCTHFNMLSISILWIRSFLIFISDHTSKNSFDKLINAFGESDYISDELRSCCLLLFELIKYVDEIFNNYEIEE